MLLHPLNYHEMLRLTMDARIMLTDSGGLQEECCVLGTPCLTLHWNTERPVSLREHNGASVLVEKNDGTSARRYERTRVRKDEGAKEQECGEVMSKKISLSPSVNHIQFLTRAINQRILIRIFQTVNGKINV